MECQREIGKGSVDWLKTKANTFTWTYVFDYAKTRTLACWETPGRADDEVLKQCKHQPKDIRLINCAIRVAHQQLPNKKYVCRNFADVMVDALDEIPGVSCDRVLRDGHMWNEVNLPGGKCYVVDALNNIVYPC